MGLQLSRYYSITSLFGILLVVAALSIYLKEITTATLISHKTNTNATLAKTFINSIWDKHSDFIRESRNFTKDSLIQRTELIELQADLQSLMQGSNIVKVKIYNNNGLTIFSTDPSQIGVDKH
ncbi:MAG: hypothetical protein ACC618_04495, partial [Patescibacteria group bacterium]